MKYQKLTCDLLGLKQELISTFILHDRSVPAAHKCQLDLILNIPLSLGIFRIIETFIELLLKIQDLN